MDNWKKWEFENTRYLDTISRLLASKGNGGCVSVILNGKTFEITTNYMGRPKNTNELHGNWKKNKTYESNFEDICKHFKNLLKTSNFNDFFKNVILNSRHFYQNHLNQIENKHFKKPNCFEDYYKQIQISIKNIDQYNVADLKCFLLYLRPMQDILKIRWKFNSTNENEITLKYKDNKIPCMHAEINQYENHKNDDIQYYGLSKLSCEFCYSKINYKSRGFHSISPRNWYDPDTKEINVNQTNEKPNMDEIQELSDDEDIESNIALDNFLDGKHSIFSVKKIIYDQQQLLLIANNFYDSLVGKCLNSYDFTELI